MLFIQVMEPYTASALQMKKSNCIKDLVAIHGYFRNNQIIYYVVYIQLSRLKDAFYNIIFNDFQHNRKFLHEIKID